METVRLVARTACVYDGRNMQVGQRFTASPEDAQLLTLLKLCDFAEPPAVEEVTAEPIEAARTSYKRQDLAADAESPTPKRAYKRRELRSEP